MRTSTRNALALTSFGALAIAALAIANKHRNVADTKQHALDAIPAGALLVATADIRALRASPAGAPLFEESREIPGLGKVKDVCGFDPFDAIEEVAIAIPAAGDTGDFGLAASGAIDDQALLACASKVIEARGGKPIVTTLGSFRDVRDASLSAGAGEIAVKKGGPLLLGGGAYLRAMIDAADGKTTTVRSSAAHSALRKALGEATAEVTVVLSPEQRAEVVRDLGPRDDAAKSIVAGGVAVDVGPSVSVHAIVACEAPKPCADLARALDDARAEKSEDTSLRLVGFGELLEHVTIDAEGSFVHARVSVPADHAAVLLDRIMKLRGFKHPMPSDESIPKPRREDPALEDAGPPAPDEVIKAQRSAEKKGDRDAGAAPKSK